MKIHHHYSEEEKSWLRENINKFDTYRDLTNAFNLFFETDVNQGSIGELCSKRLKLRRNSNAGQFSAVNKGRENAPIGTEKRFDGYIFVKVADVHTGDYNRDFRHNWKQKQRLIYEKYNRPLKENEIVIFIDRNKNNFDPENLYAISRSAHAVMCKGRHYKSEPILTKIALLSCEILVEANKAKNE